MALGIMGEAVSYVTCRLNSQFASLSIITVMTGGLGQEILVTYRSRDCILSSGSAHVSSVCNKFSTVSRRRTPANRNTAAAKTS